MNHRAAGEDFYFLQKLAKCGAVAFVRSIQIRPAGRISDRVPFGTGPAIQQYVKHRQLPSYPFYSFLSFEMLRQWHTAIPGFYSKSKADHIARMAQLSPVICDALTSIWKEPAPLLKNALNASSAAVFRKSCFHRFDGLRTLQFLRRVEGSLSKTGTESEILADLLAEIENSVDKVSNSVPDRGSFAAAAGKTDVYRFFRRRLAQVEASLARARGNRGVWPLGLTG